MNQAKTLLLIVAMTGMTIYAVRGDWGRASRPL